MTLNILKWQCAILSVTFLEIMTTVIRLIFPIYFTKSNELDVLFKYL